MVLIDRRGRTSNYNENKILNLLTNNKNPMGFNQIHREVGRTSSKSTLISILRFLVSRKEIQKTKGKYQIRTGQDFVKNIENLNHIINNLEVIIPDLNDEEEAYIGLYLWTIIFQEQTHPGLQFWTSNFITISNQLPNLKYNKEIDRFFQSLNGPNIFLDNLYRLFFKFCRKFNAETLDKVMLDVIHNRSQILNSKNKKHVELSKLLHKEIFIQRSDYETYYGTTLCNAILDVKQKALTKNTVRKIKELKISKDSFDKMKMVKLKN